MQNDALSVLVSEFPEMNHMQCPAGEHCSKRERGDKCLMWHPPSRLNTIDNAELGNVHLKHQVEEERLVQIAVMKSLEEQDTSIPDIVDVSTQLLSTLSLEDSMCDLGNASTTFIDSDLDKQNAESTCLNELLSTYLTAADSLVGEIKKDLVLEQTLTDTVKSDDLSSGRCVKEGNASKAEDSIHEEEYLNSFNISIDQERTAASYVELLHSYEGIFKKWQASEIQSQLKEMKIIDLENEMNKLQLEVMKLKVVTSDEECTKDWQEILKELGDRRNKNELLKEREEELSTYKKVHQVMEEEMVKLERKKEEMMKNLEAERKKGESQIEEARVAGEKQKGEHKAEMNKKDVKIQELEEKIKELEDRMNTKFSGGKTINGEILEVEKLKVEHNRVIILKNENIKKLMEKIVDVVEENKIFKVKLEEMKVQLKSVDPKSKDKEKLLKIIEEKDLEIREKEKVIGQHRKDKERNEVEILKASQKLQFSHENVEELLRKERGREKELQEKDREIDGLREKLKEGETEKQLLVESLCCERDENAKLKNARKVVNDNDANKIYAEIKEFKKDIMKQVKFISDLCQKKEKENENKTLEKKIEIQRCHNSDDKLRNERKCKRKPNQTVSNGCSLIDTESDYGSDASGPEEDPRGDQSTGRWRMVDGSWQQIPVKPGTKSYRDVVGTKNVEKEKRSVGKKTIIVSTSITRGISDEKFSNCYEGEVKFKRMHGGKARWMKEDVRKHFPSEEWRNVILQMGGNDLQDLYYPEAVTRLANTIIETGLICRERGAETVFVAGIPVRSYPYTWERCRTLNGELKELCRRNNFIFIDNSSITHTDHLHHDGVHLNGDGDSLLANNYLDSMKKFCTES